MIPIPAKANVLWGIAAVVFALLWTAGIYALGWHTAGVQADLRQVKGELQAEREIQADRDRLLSEKEALKKDMATMEKKHEKETADAKQTNDRLLADLRAGRVRLSVGTKAHTCPSPNGWPPPTAGADHETRAELAPEVAADLASIADDGDQSIRDLNTVIDMYERARLLKCF